MATNPREWPNNAKWARDNSAECLQEIVRLTRKLMQHNDITVVASAGHILDYAQRGSRYLLQVGAQVVEDEL